MLTIAKFTVLEAIKTRLFLFTLTAVIILLGLTIFTGELAITESQRIQTLLLASALRLFAVAMISLFVISSMAREFNDKGMEILLSLPLPRSGYYFGKLLGYACCGLLVALCVSLPLLLFAPIDAIALWFISLCCELWIIAALSLLALFTFSNITFACVAVMAFYLLARSINSIQLLSASPILEFGTFTQESMRVMVDIIALLLPDLSRFTNSSWLVYETAPGQLLPVLLQTVIYLCILAAAGLFDLYRKNL